VIERYRLVEDWEETDLLSLPDEETDYYEFKSSRVPTTKLKDKIAVAASAFWNSGGGIFIVGINDQGKVDGGVPEVVGRQKIRDWIDQILASVEPVGPYIVKLISRDDSNSLINPDHVVTVISFGESFSGPHMAPDKKYYIRAGAHSGPASHHIVEAIRARRGLQNPFLRGVLRMHPQKPNVVQLVVLNLNDAPALNVKLTFEPLPKAFLEHAADKFPLTIPVINREQSFVMDISLWGAGMGSEIFGDKPVSLKLDYRDVAGRQFEESQTLHPHQNLGPLKMSDVVGKDIKKAIEDLVREVKRLRSVIELFVARTLSEQEEYKGD